MAKRARSTTSTPKAGVVALPKWIPPMLASSATRPFDSDDHLFEVKWDGTRAIVYAEGGDLRMLNRKRFEMRERYPELDCLRRLPSGTVLDGEIVVMDKTGRPALTSLMRRDLLTDAADIARAMKKLPATLMAFDVLYERGRSVMDEPLTQRKRRLARLLKRLDDPHVVNSQSVKREGVAFFEQMQALQLEGMVAKALRSIYRPGKRSSDWIKIKVHRLETFDVIGYVPHEGGKWLSSILVGEPNADAPGSGKGWTFKASVGSGFTEKQRRELLAEMAASPPLGQKVAGGPKGSIWKQTGRRCQVQYFEMTADGMLRAPVFKGFV